LIGRHDPSKEDPPIVTEFPFAITAVADEDVILVAGSVLALLAIPLKLIVTEDLVPVPLYKAELIARRRMGAPAAL